MRELLLAAALGGLTVLTSAGASAAPSATGHYVAPSQHMITDVNYNWNNHHHYYYHHHGHYQYTHDRHY